MTFPEPLDSTQSHTPTVTYRRWWLLLIGVFVFTLPFWVWFLLQPPGSFPVAAAVEIAPGSTVTDIANQLHTADVIRSPYAFLIYTSLHGTATNLRAGTYHFTEAHPLPDLVEQLLQGDQGANLQRLTFPEGRTAEHFATIAAQTLPDFSAKVFTAAAAPYEGELFPDTYRVPPTFSEDELLALLREQFRTEMAEYEEPVAEHLLTQDEIIILASILEREANTATSMRAVSSVLQNRLDAGMPLQADASLEYVLDKPLQELTPADLQMDSPYNTYRTNGLPPTPIGNPGRVAIEAVLEPADTEYFYYITGTDGNFYYATTYDEHQDNIVRHLQ